MRSFRPLWLLAALTLTACSLLVDFEEEGQPCDSQDQCLPGYVCRDDACVSADSDDSDRDGGTDAGGQDGGGEGGRDGGADGGADGGRDGG